MILNLQTCLPKDEINELQSFIDPAETNIQRMRLWNSSWKVSSTK